MRVGDREMAINVMVWMTYSREFYHAFKMKKSLGELWFLIHELIVRKSFRFAMTDIYHSMEGHGFERGQINTALRQLNGDDLIFPVEKGGEEAPKNRDNRDIIYVNSDKQFENNWDIKLMPKISRRISFYETSIIKNIFGAREGLLVLERDGSVGKRVVHRYFMLTSTKYIDLWGGFIGKINEIVRSQDSGQNVKNDTLLRTEPYLVIHTVILFHLWGIAFSQEDIVSQIEDIRDVSARAVEMCLRRLFIYKFILNEDRSTTFSAQRKMLINNARFGEAIGKYLDDLYDFFVDLDARLREAINAKEQQFSPVDEPLV